MDNQNILKKIATGDFSSGGILNPAQSKKFFTTTVDESVLKNACRTIFMKEPVQEIDKMNVGNRVAKPKAEGVAPASGDYVGITTSKIELSTKAIIVPWEVTYDTYEDNIEGEGFEDSLLRDISAQLANDLEELYIQGDTGSGDAYLALFNGWLKLMETGGHNTDISGWGAADKVLGRKVFSAVLKNLPTKYRRNRSKLRFLVNPDQEQDYRDELVQRNTGLGDAALTDNINIRIFGIEIVPVPFIPKGNVVLTHYQNLIAGIHRKIRVEKDKDIYKGVRQYAIHMRTGVQIENTDAIAYSDDVVDPS